MAADDKKRTGLIVSYYLSRCNYKAIESLGYKTFAEAFKGIAKCLGENPNNIKNMRDRKESRGCNEGSSKFNESVH